MKIAEEPLLQGDTTLPRHMVWRVVGGAESQAPRPASTVRPARPAVCTAAAHCPVRRDTAPHRPAQAGAAGQVHLPERRWAGAVQEQALLLACGGWGEPKGR